MTSRVLTADAHALELPDGQTGEPATRLRELGRLGDLEVGVWEIDPGTAEDVEADEIFVVLSGSGTVRFDDGEQIALRPGTVVRLHEGEHTIWTIAERLRKIYIA
jgi:uncharacterized cupin superfamily protein